MANILVVGDPHAKVSSLDLFKIFETKLCELVKTLKPDAIVILGDLANDHERIHVLVLNAISDFFDALMCAAPRAQIFYTVGNHDAQNNRWFLTNDHIFHVFKGRIDQDLEIIDRPRLEFIRGQTFMFCPYVPPGRFHDALATEPNWPPDDRYVRAVFCHQEFRDVQLGPIKSQVGDVWPDTAPLAISGHIHEHQWLKPNLCYVGSPRQINDGDADDKTVSLFTFNDDGTFAEQRIDLGLPRRLTISIGVAEAAGFDVPANATVRMYVVGTTEELSVFKNSDDYRKLAASAKVILKPSDTVVVRRNASGNGFIDLLADAVSRESQSVRDVFDEAVRSAHQA